MFAVVLVLKLQLLEHRTVLNAENVRLLCAQLIQKGRRGQNEILAREWDEPVLRTHSLRVHRGAGVSEKKVRVTCCTVRCVGKLPHEKKKQVCCVHCIYTQLTFFWAVDRLLAR